MRATGLDERLGLITAACPGVSWGISVRDAATGRPLGAVHPDGVLPTASVGKVLLLVEVARQLRSGALAGDEPLARDAVAPVADSGLWQHLAVPALTAGDLCALVGAVSDNLATNVLQQRVGLDSVAALGAGLGLRATALHDRVRDVRGAGDPARLSSGSAGELADLFARLHRGEVVDAAVSRRVLDWLALDADLSMAAGAFGLDPLAHAAPDRGLQLAHKTGTDAGVRADTGVVTRGGTAIAYAVLAAWPPHPDRPDLRDGVLAAMRAVGAELAALLPPR